MASCSQIGKSNLASCSQIGKSNLASCSQIGKSNLASCSQIGKSNLASCSQIGKSNLICCSHLCWLSLNNQCAQVFIYQLTFGVSHKVRHKQACTVTGSVSPSHFCYGAAPCPFSPAPCPFSQRHALFLTLHSVPYILVKSLSKSDKK